VKFYKAYQEFIDICFDDTLWKDLTYRDFYYYISENNDLRKPKNLTWFCFYILLSRGRIKPIPIDLVDDITNPIDYGNPYILKLYNKSDISGYIWTLYHEPISSILEKVKDWLYSENILFYKFNTYTWYIPPCTPRIVFQCRINRPIPLEQENGDIPLFCKFNYNEYNSLRLYIPKSSIQYIL